MSATVGCMQWDACRNCMHIGKLGGCSLGMPEDINNFVLNFDYIECPEFKEVKK